MLRLRPSDVDQIEAFQSMHEEARQESFGYMFRSPTLWEDMVKSITLCNCGYVCQRTEAVSPSHAQSKRPYCETAKTAIGDFHVVAGSVQRMLSLTPSPAFAWIDRHCMFMCAALGFCVQLGQHEHSIVHRHTSHVWTPSRWDVCQAKGLVCIVQLGPYHQHERSALQGDRRRRLPNTQAGAGSRA